MLQLHNNVTAMEQPFDLFENLLGKGGLWEQPTIDMPLIYRTQFAPFYYRVDGITYLCVLPKDKVPSVDFMIGIHHFFSSRHSGPIILYVPAFTKGKDSLSQEGIPYISTRNDYSLFNEKEDAIFEPETPYTKVTQLVVKYLLFRPASNRSTRAISSFLGVSNTSVSRAFAFLQSLGALHRKGGSTSSVSYEYGGKEEFFAKVKPFLLLPYQRSYAAINAKLDAIKDKYICGINALSFYSDLAETKQRMFAVDKRVFAKLASYRKGDDQAVFCEWIYEPNLFVTGNVIDPLDAYIMANKLLKGDRDPRTQEAMEQLTKEIFSYEL